KRVLGGKVSPSGSLIADLELPQDAPLGMYKIRLLRDDNGMQLGPADTFYVSSDSAQGCQVSISTRQRGGAAYNVGETIRGNVHVTSAYGSQISGQPVLLSVDECPYDVVTRRRIGQWKSISRQQLRTDSIGEAAFSIQTTASADNDFQYRISATSTDADGLEFRTRIFVYATRQDIYASISTDRVLYEHDQNVSLKLRTVSATGRPESSKGTLRLLRESWQEVWVDRRGHEISGEEMLNMRRRGSGWFSFGQTAGDYLLKTQGYITSVVSEAEVETDQDGNATYAWEKAQPGYYRFVWITDGRRGTVVSNERPFWVSGPGTEVIGYRPSSIKLITNPPSEKDTTGNNLALVTVPAPNQSVLLLSGSNNIDVWKVLEVQGTAQLVKVDLNQKTPSEVTYLEATCATDEKLGRALTVLSAPNSQLMDIEIEDDKNGYEPGEDASWTISARDKSGKALAGVELVFWLRAETDGKTSARSLEALFPPARQSYSIASASSIGLKPFFMPVLTDAKLAAAAASAAVAHDKSTDDATPYSEDGEPMSSMPSAGDLFWIAGLVTGPDGKAMVSNVMPRSLSRWNVIVLASKADGMAGFARVQTETMETLSASMNAPESVFAGDVLHLSASISNNLPEQSAVFCNIFSKDIGSVTEPFHAAYLIVQPIRASTIGWDASFADMGRTMLVVTASSSNKSVRLGLDMLVKPDPALKVGYSNSLLFQGQIPLPGNAADPTARMRYRITASPARVALGGMRYLLEDPSAGSTEAAGRIASIQSLRRMFENMRFESTVIDQALTRCAANDYMDSRMQTDVERLRTTQNENGAWGWMSAESPDPFCTAYNLLMLNLCDGKMRETLDPSLEKARSYAASELVAGTLPPDMQALLLMGLASRELGLTRPSRLEARVLVNLIRMQDRLSPFALACLTLCAKQYGFDEEAQDMVRKIKATAIVESGPSNLSSAHWKGSETYAAQPASEVESTAMCALAIVATEGTSSKMLEQAVRYIFSKSADGHWDGPRETALCILALRDIAASSGETDVSAKCEITMGAQALGSYDYTRDFALYPPPWNEVLLPRATQDAAVEVSRIGGHSPVFFCVETIHTDKGSTGASSTLDGVKLTREYLRSIQVPTLLNGYDEEIVPLGIESGLKVGERVEVVLTLTLDKAMPRLLLVEPRPSFAALRAHERVPEAVISCIDSPGLKPATLEFEQSPDALVACMEGLPAGRWEIRYPLRVDFEGDFMAPSAEACLPQRPSQNASSGLRTIKCEADDATPEAEIDE
ncbi:MAG: alpha-2-macroglobulin family protein, partial [Opitutales bacterium]